MIVLIRILGFWWLWRRFVGVCGVGVLWKIISFFGGTNGNVAGCVRKYIS